MPVLKDHRHEAFAQGIARAVKPPKAYMAAFPDCSKSSASAAASRLLATVKVSARVRELQEMAANRAVATVSSLGAEIDVALTAAASDRNHAAVATNLKLKGQLYGLIERKQAAAGNTTINVLMLQEKIAALSDEQRAQLKQLALVLRGDAPGAS